MHLHLHRLLLASALLCGWSASAEPATSPRELPTTDANTLPPSSASASSIPLLKQWSLLSPGDDPRQGSEGTQTERVYRELKLVAPATPVIVAVIDSGIDSVHPALREMLWSNPGEISGAAGNDDDRNGFIDDVHGWNFLGSADGAREVRYAPLEQARILTRWRAKAEAGTLTPAQLAMFLKAAIAWNNSLESSRKTLIKTVERLDKLREVTAELAALGITENTTEALRSLSATSAVMIKLKDVLPKNLGKGGRFAAMVTSLENMRDKLAAMIKIPDDIDSVVGDDPDDLQRRGYGNGKTMGGPGSAQHGTHVAGIIAAQRSASSAVWGQCAFARIMCVRAVPSGDERDKDVALAIRYAVENGARIINCSFGKSFSPNKTVVDDACRFAESKGVLLVKAAGNDGLDLDVEPRFPNRIPLAAPERPFTNWLMVGASDRHRTSLAAPFSNYGKTQVDLFAPGVAILSSVPGERYEELQGTSMAAPNAAGVAALVLSQYPQLDAVGLRAVLMHTARTYPGLRVLRPSKQGDAKAVLFSELSISGGLIDAYAALCYLRDHQGVPPPPAALPTMKVSATAAASAAP